MKVVDLEQGGDGWLQWRRGGLGASDAPLLWFGQHFERSFNDLVLERLGQVERESRRSNWAMEQGKRFEAGARAWYEDLYQVEAQPICVVHDEYEWLRASLDGWVEETGVVLEIKYANRDDHNLALEGKVTPKYEPQLWHQALVTGSRTIHYLSGNPRFREEDQLVVVTYRVPEDKVQELLRRARVLQEAIEKGNAPSFEEMVERAKG